MRIVIEFYRMRESDDAHARVGRETAIATDLDEAITIARRLWHALDMPQQPDAMSITDSEGNRLYSATFDQIQHSGGPATDMHVHGNDNELGRHAHAAPIGADPAPASPPGASHRDDERPAPP